MDNNSRVAWGGRDRAAPSALRNASMPAHWGAEPIVASANASRCGSRQPTQTSWSPITTNGNLRDATTPDGTGTMCRKSALTSRAVRLGLPIREHFCDRQEPDGEPQRCAHFDDCAYLAQLAPTENGGARQHYLATSYLSSATHHAASVSTSCVRPAIAARDRSSAQAIRIPSTN